MSVQFASFFIPTSAGSEEEEELNRFLRGHRVLATRKRLDSTSSPPRWLFLVEYHAEASRGESGDTRSRNRIDYREILSPGDFLVYSRLRDLRKKAAEEARIPVYAVFTNEQLAEMAKGRPTTLEVLKGIDGIGAARVDRFGQAFLAVIEGARNEAGGVAF